MQQENFESFILDYMFLMPRADLKLEVRIFGYLEKESSIFHQIMYTLHVVLKSKAIFIHFKLIYFCRRRHI